MKHIELLRMITETGRRVFSTRDVLPFAKALSIEASQLSSLLRRLVEQKFLRKLFRGTFALSNTILSGSPLHEYEIAHHLSNPSVICCWSALSFHRLTDQVLRTVYLMSPLGKTKKSTSQYHYQIENTQYVIIRVQPSLFFGYENRFLADIPFTVTDLERTLIDGLVRPQYCGGFFEVMEAFRQAEDQINADKITEYARKFGLGISKRLGWVFETLEIFPNQSQLLKALPCSSHYPVDVSRPDKGIWLPEWNLRRNF